MLVLLIIGRTVGTLFIPTLTADILNGITSYPPHDMSYVWEKGGIMLGVAAATAIASIVSTYLSTYIATAMGRDIRGALFRKVQSFSTNDFNQFGAASLITRSTNDVTQVQQSFSIIVDMLLPAPFMTVAALVLAFRKSGNLAFILVGFMAVIMVILVIIALKVVPVFEKLQTSLDGINRKVRDEIIGVRVIRAFNREGDEKQKTDETFNKYAKISIRANKLFAIMLPLVMFLMYACSVIIIWIGGDKVISGSIGPGDISAIIEYSMLTLMYLIMGVSSFMFIPRAHTCAKRINAVLNVKPEFVETEHSESTEEETSAKVVFDNVTFRYPGAEETVLENINFEVPKGKTTAIIGSTGSGKSTVANLILRLYDVSEGRIVVDGKNVKDYTLEALRDKIGIVPQKAFLFSGTIADNLRHGKKDAIEEEMRHAVEIAQIADFIDGKPEGFNYPVSQGGTNFSGGQKQRLSIARAIIKKPDIYVFDDSFSALDFKTDAKLRAALKDEVGDSAVIIVAQRISTILDADQILVLDEGKLVGKGTHKELIANCEIYRQIAQSQLSEEELA
ncbi:MAG: ABC transporter ATP-binding protein/permease [Muribaculaceae bacterium]|nr:ABC transporter ATP-binding protein/permease [Muribaculaceae bacterium]